MDVTANSRMPFTVEVGDSARMRIQVLGTSFNVNAYAGYDHVKTTLATGRVRIDAGRKGYSVASQVLRPGEQAIYRNESTRVVKVDMEEVLAWKNGLFEFNDDMEAIMEQLKRWYQADVVFKNKIPHRFIATIRRSEPLWKVLHLLEATGKVHFVVKGKTIFVSE